MKKILDSESKIGCLHVMNLLKVVDSSIRNKLSTWISQCAESRYVKSGGTATRLRDEG